MGANGNGAEGPFVLAVPSKGRLQEAAHAFFARAGLELVQGRGARDYRGAIAGLPGIEVAYVSSAEIVGQLAAGAAHFGVAGEDLLREKIPDVEARLELLSPLGFGHANVVVAAPKAWIDVRTMADLDDVASAYRAKRGERMRVATKYVNLTRRYFAEHGIVDYRIVESLGATEGAPASGAAELIVDITTTGATLEANALKTLDDGTILRSQANLIASLTAPWGANARQAARDILAEPSACRGRDGRRALRRCLGDRRGRRSARVRRAALRPRQSGGARRLAAHQGRRASERRGARTDFRRAQCALRIARKADRGGRALGLRSVGRDARFLPPLARPKDGRPSGALWWGRIKEGGRAALTPSAPPNAGGSMMAARPQSARPGSGPLPAP
jgi:ATP phosphoribosyltransferase